MNKRISLLLSLLLLCGLLAACSSGHKNSGDATTLPLDNLLASVTSLDTAKYRSAFPPDYIDRVEAELPLIGEDIDTKIKTDMELALDAREMDFGSKSYVFYTLTASEKLDVSTLYGDYGDYYIDGYTIPEGSVSEAYTVTALLTAGGNSSESRNTASFVVLSISGVWYLHPKYFLYMI